MLLVALMVFRVIVRRPIDINKSRVLADVGKIRPGLIGFIKMLGPGRETEGMGFEEIEKLSFQPRIAEAFQLFKVHGPRHLDGRNDHTGIPEFKEEIADCMPVKKRVIRLIVIAEQAVVAGRLAVFLGVFRFSKV